MTQMQIPWEAQLDVIMEPVRFTEPKPVLVVSCSAAKDPSSSSMTALERYQGAMFQYIKANGLDEVFNIFILSAKYGLVGANDIVGNYDVQMSDVDKELYIAMHCNGIHEQLKSASKGLPIYAFLPIQYREVFEEVMGMPSCHHWLRATGGLYTCWHHVGNGDHKKRLGQAAQSIRENGSMGAVSTVYRSGVSANLDEIVGYVSSGESVGTSLAFLRDNTLTVERAIKALVLGAYRGRVFVDNGMLQMLDEDESDALELSDVVAEYQEFALRIKQTVQALEEECVNADVYSQPDCFHGDVSRVLRAFTFVVPDDPFDADASMAIIEDNLDTLKQLLDLGVELIVPMHKRLANQVEDIDVRARRVLSLFGGYDNIRLGIPTLNDAKRPFALPLPVIEKLISVRESGEYLVKRVHLLGQGETNATLVAKSRRLLLSMYPLDVSMDAMRTRPFFQAKARNKAASDDELVKLNVGTLSQVMFDARACEEDDPVYLHYWIACLHEHGVEHVEALWRAGSANLERSMVPLSLECGDEDELVEALSLSTLNEYVDVWIAAHWEEYMREHDLPMVTGQKKRMRMIARGFGKSGIADKLNVDWSQCVTQAISF
ncbi:DUF6884 domain-containing protein [Vibrio sp. PNB22_3_1]